MVLATEPSYKMTRNLEIRARVSASCGSNCRAKQLRASKCLQTHFNQRTNWDLRSIITGYRQHRIANVKINDDLID